MDGRYLYRRVHGVRVQDVRAFAMNRHLRDAEDLWEEARWKARREAERKESFGSVVLGMLVVAGGGLLTLLVVIILAMIWQTAGWIGFAVIAGWIFLGAKVGRSEVVRRFFG